MLIDAFTAFNCCYCSTFNAARKIRPLAPKLTVDNQTQEVKSKAESNFGVQENVGVTNDTQLENANVQNNASFKNGDDNTANNDGTVNENTPNERKDCIDVSPDMLAVNNDAAAASSNCGRINYSVNCFSESLVMLIDVCSVNY